jgi:plastocyanin
VPQGTAGGTVTLNQTATTEPAPTGFQLGSVQVVISAPTASATNPLTLVFTITPSPGQTPETTQIYRTESSGTPTLVSDCDPATQDPASPSYKQAIADPCVWDKRSVTIGGVSYIQATVLTSQASAWNVALPRSGAVGVSDSGYSPSQLTVQLGATVNWTFLGKKAHSATDSVGLGATSAPLFDSGAKTSGNYSTRFRAAGSYAYKSTAKGDKLTGSVLVPVLVARNANGYAVVWATSKQTGYVFDVRYRFRASGSTKWTAWTAWKTGVDATNANFVPTQGAGTYSFTARLRNASTGKYSGDSPEASFTLS